MELSIAKETYNDPKNLKIKIDNNKWVKFIDDNNNYFICLEDYNKGNELLDNF